MLVYQRVFDFDSDPISPGVLSMHSSVSLEVWQHLWFDHCGWSQRLEQLPMLSPLGQRTAACGVLQSLGWWNLSISTVIGLVIYSDPLSQPGLPSVTMEEEFGWNCDFFLECNAWLGNLQHGSSRCPWIGEMILCLLKYRSMKPTEKKIGINHVMSTRIRKPHRLLIIGPSPVTSLPAHSAVHWGLKATGTSRRHGVSWMLMVNPMLVTKLNQILVWYIMYVQCYVIRYMNPIPLAQYIKGIYHRYNSSILMVPYIWSSSDFCHRSVRRRRDLAASDSQILCQGLGVGLYPPYPPLYPWLSHIFHYISMKLWG